MGYRTCGYGLGATLLLFTLSNSTAAEHTRDSLETVSKNLEEKKAVLVDVREKREWDQGHIAGAVFVPLSELRKGVDADTLKDRVPKGKIVYTHCAVGKRAITAAEILEKLGYEVRPLKPGYNDLLEGGFKKAADKDK